MCTLVFVQVLQLVITVQTIQSAESCLEQTPQGLNVLNHFFRVFTRSTLTTHPRQTQGHKDMLLPPRPPLVVRYLQPVKERQLRLAPLADFTFIVWTVVIGAWCCCYSSSSDGPIDALSHWQTFVEQQDNTGKHSHDQPLKKIQIITLPYPFEATHLG